MTSRYFNMNFKNSKASFASLNLIVFYLVLVSLDIITTLLTNVDLKYEGNFITTFFVATPEEFIVYVIIIAVTSVLLVYYANRYLIKTNKFTNQFRSHFEKAKYIFSLIIIVFFYTHIISLIWVIPNNLAHFIGINGNSNWIFYTLSLEYINFCSIFFPCYQLSIQLISLLLSIAFFRNQKANIFTSSQNKINNLI